MQNIPYLRDYFAAVWEYGQKWLTGSVLISAAGMMANFLSSPLPAWFWILVLSFGISIAQFKAYTSIRERVGSTAPIANLPLDGLVSRIVGSADYVATGNPAKVSDALLAIRQAAIFGQIKSWGRSGAEPASNERLLHYPLTEIGKDSWARENIDYLDFLSNRRGGLDDSKFYDLYFNQAETDVLWPTSRDRLFRF